MISLCAHCLPLDEQGKLIYIFSTYIGVVLINVSGIFQGAAVRAPTQNNSYFSALAKLQIVSAILLSPLITLIWFYVAPYFGWKMTLCDIALVAVYLIIQQLCDFSRRASYIFSDTRKALFFSLWTYPGRIAAIIIIRPNELYQVLLILIVSAGIAAVNTVKEAYRANSEPFFWRKDISRHLNYSKFFIGGSLLSWFWSYAPLFILGMMQGKAAAALLASIRGISSIANIFMEQLEIKAAADWSIIYNQKGFKKLKSTIFRLNIMALTFWASVMAVIFFYGSDIVKIILGRQYSHYSYVLSIAWLSYGAFYIVRVNGIQHRVFGDNKIEFISGVIGLLAALISSYFLVAHFKLSGAAWSYVIIAASMLFAQVLFAKRHQKLY